MRRILVLPLPFCLGIACSVQKRHYAKGFYVDWNNKRSSVTDKKATEFPRENNEAVVPKDLTASANALDGIITSTSTGDSCDVIVMMNGDEILAIVTEISPVEIRYKNCKHQSGPVMVIYKKDALFIKYSTGEKYVVDHSKDHEQPGQAKVAVANYPAQTDQRKTEGLSVTAFILSLVAGSVVVYGSVGAGVLLMVLSIIFAAIGMTKISKSPERYKGKGFAVAALVISVIALISSMFVFLNS
jgi:hypothetical protein